MNNIDEIRGKKNLSYDKIAFRTGIAKSYIFQLAKGIKANPSLDVMKKIATALGSKVEKVFKFN